MMKTTRSYRIGTSRLKHRCNRYKNNYYKKKKKKKCGVQAGCEEARVVWEKGRSRNCYLLTPPFLHLSLQHQLRPPDWSPPSKPTAAKSQ
jgi:hypothetical protein